LAFEVVPYTIDNLKAFFFRKALAEENIISQKQHISYFENYFSAIGTQTIVYEFEYINRDFLEDYSSYYVRSFKDYDRKCSRVHFFKNVFSQQDFQNLIRGEGSGIAEQDLIENYQGFIVLKPLPTTIIGKTCLVTYEFDGRRFFPPIRKYDVNLFGIPLKVVSLAYQEQDSIVAACASSAIWSAFHGTAILFQHSLPSPVEITKSAIIHFPFSNRNFPNKGLSGEQMALTIREIGLDPYLYNADSYDTVKATIYAYLKGKIPVILGYSLWNINGNSKASAPVLLGKHAVAVTGYSLGGGIKNSFENLPNLKLWSSKIDKIYVHDDQIGPFARMEFNNLVLNIDDNTKIESIDTTCRDANGAIDKIKAVSEILIIPLYHKIRIPFYTILMVINKVKHLQEFINNAPGLPSFAILEWDIYLADISEFKIDILKNANVANGDYKEKLLTDNYPKYLWRAIGMIGDRKKIELLFDATDIDQGVFYLKYISYDTTTENYFKLIASLISGIVDMNLKAILDSFK
jgi:hypothetical protein